MTCSKQFVRMHRSATGPHFHTAAADEVLDSTSVVGGVGKQFVIGGNEFLIIETDNVLWHLEQCQ